MEGLQDRSRAATLGLSAEGTVRGWSAAAQRLLGFPADEIVGRAFASLAQDPQSLERSLARVRHSDAIQALCLTTHLQTKAGRDAPTLLCADAVRDGDGHVQGFLVTLRDLETVAFELGAEGQRGRLAVPDSGALKGLTPRQRLVLELIARGYSTREIAQRLGRSVKTVETHRAQLMKRLNIHHVPGLVGFAIRAGVVTLE